MEDSNTKNEPALASVTSCPGRFVPEHNGSSCHKHETSVHLQNQALHPGEKYKLRGRFVFVIGLCCFIFLAHTLLIILMGNTAFSDISVMTDREASGLAESGLKNEPSEITNVDTKPRHKRDTSVDKLDSEHLQDMPLNNHENLPENHNFMNLDSRGVAEQCRSGHVQGLGPICDPTGCLEKLNKGMLSVQANHHDMQAIPAGNSSIPTTATARSKNMIILSVLASVQWESEIYGSLGFFNSHASFLDQSLLNFDIASGERIFISGNVQDKSKFKSNSMEGTAFNQEYTAQDNGLLESMSSSMLVYQGDQQDLSKIFFRDKVFPQFRMISISENQDTVSMLTSLKKASCILRDGGIISVQGLTAPGEVALSSVRQYFAMYGVSALSPFLLVKDRLYICTTNWKERLVIQVLNNEVLKHKFSFKKENNGYLGVNIPYISIQR